MAAQSFLQNLVQLRGIILCASRGAADPFPQPRRRSHYEREHGETYQSQLPVIVQQNEQQANDDEYLPEEVGQDVRGGHLDFLDVIHDG